MSIRFIYLLVSYTSNSLRVRHPPLHGIALKCLEIPAITRVYLMGTRWYYLAGVSISDGKTVVQGEDHPSPFGSASFVTGLWNTATPPLLATLFCVHPVYLLYCPIFISLPPSKFQIRDHIAGLLPSSAPNLHTRATTRSRSMGKDGGGYRVSLTKSPHTCLSPKRRSPPVDQRNCYFPPLLRGAQGFHTSDRSDRSSTYHLQIIYRSSTNHPQICHLQIIPRDLDISRQFLFANLV